MFEGCWCYYRRYVCIYSWSSGWEHYCTDRNPGQNLGVELALVHLKLPGLEPTTRRSMLTPPEWTWSQPERGSVLALLSMWHVLHDKLYASIQTSYSKLVKLMQCILDKRINHLTRNVNNRCLWHTSIDSRFTQYIA